MKVVGTRLPPPSLSTRLHTGTRTKHFLVEHAPFTRCLLSGRISRRSYERLVESLYFVYAEMEAVLECHRRHPVLSLLDFTELRRRPSLEEDLAFWMGPTWRTSTSLSPATRMYVARIRAVADQDPLLLVGHLYTRYLGDLSGGQIVGRAIERAFGLTEGGARFYRFGPDRAGLAERYRARLDALPVDGLEAELIVAEASETFGLNLNLFEELARGEER